MILTLNGIDLNFQVFGDGPPLVVLHGWADSGATWLRVAHELQDAFRVFLIDLPGCGHSDPPPTVWGVAEYEQLLVSFMQELELTQPILLGHSHGGKIAATYVAHGHDAQRLILVSTSGLDTKSLEVRAKILWFKFLKQLLLRCGSWGKQKLESIRSRVGSRDYREAGAMRDTMVKVVNQKLFDLVPRISVPTLVLWGSEDQTLSMNQAKSFRKLIRGSRIRILWGATHHPHLDTPAELASLVREFCVEPNAVQT